MKIIRKISKPAAIFLAFHMLILSGLCRSVSAAMINLAVILLRYTRPDLERPYRVPVNVGKFPILPLFGLGATIYMGFQFELEIVLAGLGILVAGIVFYFIYNRRK